MTIWLCSLSVLPILDLEEATLGKTRPGISLVSQSRPLASCVAYGYMPSPKKPLLPLDPTPLAWAPPGKVHPPLAEACRARGGGGRRVVGGRQNVVVGWGCGAGKRQYQSSHCLASSAYLNKHQSTSVNNSQQQSTHSQHTVNTQSTRA